MYMPNSSYLFVCRLIRNRTSLRHATYRASLIASSAFRCSRVSLQPFQHALIARPQVALFSTRLRLYSDRLEDTPSAASNRFVSPIDDSEASKTLYIGNLFFDVTPGQLRQHFDPHGKVAKTRVVTSPEGHSKGYAFVEYEDLESAKTAQIATNLSVFAGRRIVVHYARPQAGSQPRYRTKEPTSTLFIGNLHFDLSDRELNELFRPLANIRDVRVSVDRKTGKPRGFAHADFMDVNSAIAAFEQLNGRTVRERSLRCDYSDAPVSPKLDRERAAAVNQGKSASGAPQQNAPEQAGQEKTISIENENKDQDVQDIQAKDEGSHEPPQDLEKQPESNQEKEFEQPEEHATQKLEEEVEKVPEDQAEKKN